MPKDITDATFEQDVLQSTTPVMVDFWAPWCGPCRQLSPIIEELADENKGKNFSFLKLNIDENNESPSRYGVMSIPTMIFFKDGKPVDQMTGVQDKVKIQSKIDELAE